MPSLILRRPIGDLTFGYPTVYRARQALNVARSQFMAGSAKLLILGEEPSDQGTRVDAAGVTTIEVEGGEEPTRTDIRALAAGDLQVDV